MLKLSEVSHNPRPSGLKMLAKFIRRGIRVLLSLSVNSLGEGGSGSMITLKEIAKEAGVSAMTVSNVVNGNFSKVSKENAERIQRIMQERKYVPNSSAAASPATIQISLPLFCAVIKMAIRFKAPIMPL